MESSKNRKILAGGGTIAAVSGLIFGLIAHLFAITNILHNYDDIASQPGGYGLGVELGRWLLDILGRITQNIGFNYNLHAFNGIVFILFLAVSAGILVSYFEIQNKFSAAAIGMLFTAFPTVAATLFFRYTAPLYGLGVLLAVLAAWIFERHKYGLLLAALLGALSMGIYQAYIPLTIGMFVLRLIAQALDGQTTVQDILRKGLRACGALALALILYFAGQKTATVLTGVALDDYRGVSAMGQISLTRMPELVFQAFKTVVGLPFRDFAGVAVRKVQQLTYLLLGLVTVVMIGVCLVVKVRKVRMALAVGALCLVFPVATNFIVVMCPDNWIYTLMVYGLVLLGCAPLVIYEQLPPMEGLGAKLRPVLTKAMALGMALLIYGYAYYANTNYTALYYANRQIENYVNSITVQVRMTEGFTPDQEWALLGDINDPLLDCQWEEETTYGGSGFTEYLLNQYSREGWFQMYVGYKLPLASEEKMAELAQSAEVKAMPVWPAQGSIQIVENTVVIKFQELT